MKIKFTDRFSGKGLIDRQREKIRDPYTKKLPGRVDCGEVEEAIKKIFEVNKEAITVAIKDLC
ncbi:MAG: hypothetical protein ABH830_01005 [Patescibacteria group bacterium]